LVLLVAGAAGAFYVWKEVIQPADASHGVVQNEAKEDSEAKGSHLEPIEMPAVDKGADATKSPPAAASKPPDPPKPPPLTEDQKKVNAAIDKGVAYLRGQLKTANAGMVGLDPPGTIGGASITDWKILAAHLSLMGLTLLECDVPAKDSLIQDAATGVRKAADELTTTYALAVAIMFLDRLGDPRDRELIKILALRLIAGQTDGGNWDYASRKLSDVEQSTLLDFLRAANYATGDAAAIKTNQAAAANLPDAVKALSVVRWCCGEKLPIGHGGNNSTTQFGLLGLWIAQRSGVPVHPALAMNAAHFRASQHDDGSWSYEFNNPGSKSSLTCAGLLGLAVGRDLDVRIAPKEKKADKVRDPAVDRGMRFVGNTISAVQTSGQGEYLGKLYYLWSVERVGVIYGVKKIAGKDWYDIASKILLNMQKPDGHWEDAFPGTVDTCFALLVLKRANVAQDLTKRVEQYLDIKHNEEAP
jgi:hypothetical protein